MCKDFSARENTQGGQTRLMSRALILISKLIFCLSECISCVYITLNNHSRKFFDTWVRYF